MQEFLSNGVVQSVTGALILAGLALLYRNYQFRQDESKILRFMDRSKIETDNIFRSTHAIASGANLPEERVKVVCGKSLKTTRNQKEKESWRLSD
ncbi:MAG: hypothetical protein DHS20C12_06110 [Pseudohongiella sp.]|nr:MAG: hypothetical protein DHS20C12_06110 [Pseudohongiella sp.]